MKKLLIAALAASLSLSLFGLDIMTYVPLKDGVKSYTCTEYSIATKFGDYFKTVTGKVSHTIDASGNDVESAEYSARGTLLNSVRTSYDSMGNILSQSGFDASNELMWKTEFVYKKGARTEANDFDADGNLRTKTVYKYENGLMVDETGYDSKGALVWKTIYKYDSSNRLEKESQYLSDGSLDGETLYAYKDDGKLESVTYVDVYDGITQDVFRYSAAGVLSEVTTYNVTESGNKVSERFIVKYDDNGNVVKVSDYKVADKFGGTVNELVYMADYSYEN